MSPGDSCETTTSPAWPPARDGSSRGPHDSFTRLFPASGDSPPKAPTAQWPSGDQTTIRSVALASDETLAACGSLKGNLQIVRIPDGTPAKLTRPDATERAHDDSIDAIAFSPGSDWLATGSLDRTVRLWCRDGDEIVEWATLPASGPVTSVAFGSDGKRLAVLSLNDRAVEIWRLDLLRAEVRQMGLHR